VILLDTNALIWVATGHARSRPLAKRRARLYVSPASLLEVQLALEAGRVSLPQPMDAALHDDRWVVDQPPAVEWFLAAGEVGWTRDPFDRLLVAHALLRRWQLATADAHTLEQLGPSRTLEL
jgi:PIN domain nuclease of toxin-antitoxin system